MIIKVKRLNKLFDVIIDDKTYELIAGKKLYISNQGYVRIYNGKIGRGTSYLLLHKLILPFGSLVDHINGNKLDNRSSNLRVADKRINAHNSKRKRILPKNISYSEVKKSYAFDLKIGPIRYRKKFSNLSDAISYKNHIYNETKLVNLVHGNHI